MKKDLETNYLLRASGVKEPITITQTTLFVHKAYITRVIVDIRLLNNPEPINYERRFTKEDMTLRGWLFNRGAYIQTLTLAKGLLVFTIDPTKAVEVEDRDESLISIANELDEERKTGKSRFWSLGYSEHIYKDKEGNITEYLYQEEKSNLTNPVRHIIFRPEEVWFDYGIVSVDLIEAIARRTKELQTQKFFKKGI